MKEDYIQEMLKRLENCPTEFLRDSAKIIKQTGYLDMSTFFDSLTDIDIQTILVLFQDSQGFSEQALNSYDALALLTILLSVGSGVYYESQEEAQESVLTLYAYVLLENQARRMFTDKALRELRSRYDIQKYPDFLGMNV
jgi:hypothetical protein